MTFKASDGVNLQVPEKDIEMLKRVFNIAELIVSKTQKKTQQSEQNAQGVIVTLSFTLARRESVLLGLRVEGGLRAKREAGGFCGVAPDAYQNITTKTTVAVKKLQGRHERWIELDPEHAPIIRYAFDLLLEDKLTLEGICEALHERGYRYKSGRPFIEVKRRSERKVNKNTLSSIYHNWTYAGWVTSKAGHVPPKTIRGHWEPIVTTEEFERG
jgi:hypothetical protein